MTAVALSGVLGCFFFLRFLVDRVYKLRKLFNRPDIVFDDFYGVLRALVNHSPAYMAQKIDNNVVSEVTGKSV